MVAQGKVVVVSRDDAGVAADYAFGDAVVAANVLAENTRIVNTVNKGVGLRTVGRVDDFDIAHSALRSWKTVRMPERW